MSRRDHRNSERNKRDKMPAPPRWRGWFVLTLFAVFAVVLAGRAFDLQVLDRDGAAKMRLNRGSKPGRLRRPTQYQQMAFTDRHGQPYRHCGR